MNRGRNATASKSVATVIAAARASSLRLAFSGRGTIGSCPHTANPCRHIALPAARQAIGVLIAGPRFRANALSCLRGIPKRALAADRRVGRQVAMSVGAIINTGTGTGPWGFAGLVGMAVNRSVLTAEARGVIAHTPRAIPIASARTGGNGAHARSACRAVRAAAFVGREIALTRRTIGVRGARTIRRRVGILTNTGACPFRSSVRTMHVINDRTAGRRISAQIAFRQRQARDIPVAGSMAVTSTCLGLFTFVGRGAIDHPHSATLTSRIRSRCGTKPSVAIRAGCTAARVGRFTLPGLGAINLAHRTTGSGQWAAGPSAAVRVFGT